MGKLIRGTTEYTKYVIVEAKDIVQSGLDIHGLTRDAAVVFGQLLIAGTIMGANLKGEDMMSLITDSNGKMRKMLVSSHSDGTVKGYVSDPEAKLAEGETTLMGHGTLKVIKDMGLKEPYVGVSELITHNLPQDIAYYYFTSEQTPTVIALGVKMKSDTEVEAAGGYMVQLLPGAPEEYIDAMEAKIKAIYPVETLLAKNMKVEDILHLLYEDMTKDTGELMDTPNVLEEKEVKYECHCDKDRFYRGLLGLGAKELGDIFKTEGFIETECNFCGKKYRFEPMDFAELLAETISKYKN